MDTEIMTWNETIFALEELKKEFSSVQELDLKDPQREILSKQLRKNCVEIHYLRIQLNQQKNYT